MARLSYFLLACLWMFFQLVSGAFDLAAKNNVAVYYGQGPDQIDLINYCKQPSIDIIVLAFVHIAPAQGNGLPGTNFGNQCGFEVYGNSRLLSNCTRLADQIPKCQTQYGKKVLLSIGGAAGAYGLNGAADGKNFADLVWEIFGPQQPSSNKPRPFGSTSVDGFDLDIEARSDGYVDFARQLRANFAKVKNRTFLLTAAPQCPVPDLNVGDIIKDVQIDALLLQFYNTPYCSAATWVANNKDYKPGAQANTKQFSYNEWVNWLQNTASKNTRIYIGLPGGNAAAGQGQYVDPAGAKLLMQAHYCHPAFGGVAIWEATYADRNVVNGKAFFQAMKDILVEAGNDPKVAQCSANSTSTSKPASGTTYTTKPASGSPSSKPASASTSKPASGSSSSKPASATSKPASGSTAKPTTLTTSTAKPSSSAASSSARSSASPSAAPSSGTTSDGSCGPNKPKCPSGYCCSKHNYCGTTPEYCGAGCLVAYGMCSNTSNTGSGSSTGGNSALEVSTNGSCGPGVATCKGNPGGQCCSQWGYCGSSSGHCGVGCKKDFGICT